MYFDLPLKSLSSALVLVALSAVSFETSLAETIPADPGLDYPAYTPSATDRVISRSDYAERMHGFWLGQSIANWTGIVTELVKVEPPFFTDEDWGKPAVRAPWGTYAPHAGSIDYFGVEEGRVWGADDDTDVEYMYQHLLDTHNVSVLSPEQIRDGWLHHIYSDSDAPISPIRFQRENALWVSNQRAYDLMLEKGLLPPATSEPVNNPDYDKIDAQLTTEIFGLMAPGRVDVARRMAYLPIRTTASAEAAEIAQFYVTMHALAIVDDTDATLQERLLAMADAARAELDDDLYPAAMYDFIKAHYEANADKDDWESTRDAVYERYQLNKNDGYPGLSAADAGINFAAGMVSFFYGQGDLPRTIRIGALAGWDSDNPTATWGGLLGFMLGRAGVEEAFAEYTGDMELSQAYWITRTRRNFPDYTPDEIGEDSFPLMARRAVNIIDRVVIEEMNGGVSVENDSWYVPVAKNDQRQ
jgi:hypothetical protein